MSQFSDGYSTIKPPGDYDYEEEYFEPANMEEELYLQLKELCVPIISKENLQYVEN